MVTKIIQIILSPILALAVGVFFLGLARKIMARIHWRYGPPLIQPIIDIIRLLCQKSVSHGRMFDLGIIFSLAGSIVLIGGFNSQVQLSQILFYYPVNFLCS